LESSLRSLGVLCVSAVHIFSVFFYRRDAEDAEITQRSLRSSSFTVISFPHSRAMPLRKVWPMAVSQELLEMLACPACKAKVELKPDESALKCVECKRVYPIRDDIPVMLIDEACIED